LSRKFSLPVAGPAAPSRLDAARARLGGRAASDAGVGDLVGFVDEGGQGRLGVTLFVRGDELSVWTSAGFVRQLPRAETRAVDAAIPADLAKVSEAARRFAQLAEGDRVACRDGESEGVGKLVEKCRFGAVVARDDGSLVAVGFARVAALEPGSDA
jgi:hypothetical protein